MRLNRLILIVLMLFSSLSLLFAEVTIDQVKEKEARLKELVSLMETDADHYDQYKAEFDQVQVEFKQLKDEYKKQQSADKQLTSCMKQYNKANSQLRLRNYDQALTIVNGALAKCPDLDKLHLAKAIALKGSGDYTGAEASYLKAIELSPKCAKIATYNLGVMYINNLNRTKDGLAKLKEALECDQEYYKAWYQIGKVYTEQQKNKLAATNLEKAVSIKPDYTLAVVALAKVYLKMNRKDDACRLSNNSVTTAKKTDESEIYHLLATGSNDCGKYDQALKAADNGLKFKNKLRRNKSYISGGLYFEKGRALEAKEEWQAGVNAYRQALEFREWRQNAEYQIEKKIKREHPEVQ